MTEFTVADQANTLRKLVRRTARAKRPPILAVASGKGGVGKTVLSVNMALRFAATGTRTLLIDLDPGLANVDVHMRLHAKHTVDDILHGRCEAEDAVLVGASGLMIIPGGTTAWMQRDRTGPAKILEALEPLMQRIDLVILDTGAGIGPWVMGSVEAADLTTVVTQPDPASVTDSYALIKVCRSLKPASTPALAINRVRDKREALLTATRLRKIAKRFLDVEPDLLGWLHEQEDVQVSVRNQIPFLIELPDDHRAVLDLAGLVSRTSGCIRDNGGDPN